MHDLQIPKSLQINAEGKGDGARYRVRTCDPYRVKVVLYH